MEHFINFYNNNQTLVNDFIVGFLGNLFADLIVGGLVYYFIQKRDSDREKKDKIKTEKSDRLSKNVTYLRIIKDNLVILRNFVDQMYSFKSYQYEYQQKLLFNSIDIINNTDFISINTPILVTKLNEVIFFVNTYNDAVEKFLNPSFSSNSKDKEHYRAIIKRTLEEIKKLDEDFGVINLVDVIINDCQKGVLNLSSET